MHPSSNCVNLIKKWEGCHERLGNGLLRAYKCPAGVWTIGWGSITMDGRPVKEGDLINQAKADALLAKEIAEKADGVNTLCGGLVNQNQFDALVSFAYNLGVGALAESTLLKLLKAGKHTEAADQFLRWVHAGGEVLEGLVNRRKDERALFLAPVNDVQPVGVDERVTWLEMHRLEENGNVRAGCVGYAGADALVTWDGTDKGSLIQFLQRFPNAGTVQVAPAGKAWPTLKPVEKPKPRLVLKKFQPETLDPNGLYPMTLALMVGDERKAIFSVRSGAPGRQVFQKGGTGEIPGTLYPCPQGEYSVEDISWAGGKDNYSASHGPGLGPVFVPFEPKFNTKRGAFGIHRDDNFASSPGSAGCIVIRELQDLKNFVEVLREYDPKVLVVDWGL